MWKLDGLLATHDRLLATSFLWHRRKVLQFLLRLSSLAVWTQVRILKFWRVDCAQLRLPESQIRSCSCSLRDRSSSCSGIWEKLIFNQALQLVVSVFVFVIYFAGSAEWTCSRLLVSSDERLRAEQGRIDVNSLKVNFFIQMLQRKIPNIQRRV